jgi:hypothetical protein
MPEKAASGNPNMPNLLRCALQDHLTQISFEVSSKKTASSLTVHSGQLNSPQRKKRKLCARTQTVRVLRGLPKVPSLPRALPPRTSLALVTFVIQLFRNPQFGSHSPQKQFPTPKLGTNRVQRCAPTTSCRVRTEFEPSPIEFRRVPTEFCRVQLDSTEFCRVRTESNRFTMDTREMR